MSKSTLPASEVERLKSVYESGDREALKSLIKALRDQKWPLRAIGDPLGLSRSTIQFWERAATEDPEVTVPMSPRAIETAGVKTLRRRTEMPDSLKKTLRRYADQAKQVRSQTPANSPLREASASLDYLIEDCLMRMIPVTDIAEAMGVTHRAVKARVERRHDSSN